MSKPIRSVTASLAPLSASVSAASVPVSAVVAAVAAATASASRRRRHWRKGSTTSKEKGPSVMSMRSVPSLRWARTVV